MKISDEELARLEKVGPRIAALVAEVREARETILRMSQAAGEKEIEQARKIERYVKLGKAFEDLAYDCGFSLSPMA